MTPQEIFEGNQNKTNTWSKGQFYLGEEDGKSYIYKGQLETTSYPHDFNPLKDEPFNKYRIETNE